MRPIQRIISLGFATCALASASLPALSWTVWPNAGFEWSLVSAPMTFAPTVLSPESNRR